MSNSILGLEGPVCVLGSTGFIGRNLIDLLKMYRSDVHGSHSHEMWNMIEQVKPKTVFNCIAYVGGKSYNEEPTLIYGTNFVLTQQIMQKIFEQGCVCYVHAGTSMEYGAVKNRPHEDIVLHPTTHYAISKVASSNLIYYYGKVLKKKVCNLRLYCVYGPHEKHFRLVPTIILECRRMKRLPDFVNADVTRDFIYVDDVCRAFIMAAVHLKAENYGKSFNVGTGKETTIAEVAELARTTFGIKEEPKYSRPLREGETTEVWAANIEKSQSLLGYKAQVGFYEGFIRTAEWFKSYVK